MYYYSAFGLSVSSELELPHLLPGSRQFDVEIRLGSVKKTQQMANDSDHIIFVKNAGGFHMKSGRQIVVDPAPEADTDLIRVILTGRAMALLLRQQGWLPLHASGVVIDGRAILFLGPSGAGKSSTAAALRARGHTVITDDVAIVRTVNGKCCVRPASSLLRLTPDSMDLLKKEDYLRTCDQLDKSAVQLAQPSLQEEIHVQRIHVLDFADEFRMEDVPLVTAAVSLSVHSFVRRRQYEWEQVKAHVRQCAETAGVVPLTRIFRRRCLRELPEMIRMVERQASGSC
jgi:hypothetical protein